MNLKTYRAKTIADALSQVKKDLGRDAVILHTRMVKVGGWLGVGRRNVVEITAGHGVNVRGPVVRQGRAPATQASAPSAPTELAPALAARAAAATDAYVRAARPAPAAPQPAPPAPRAASLASTAPLAAHGGPAAVAVEQELAAIKSMIARVLSGSARSRCGLMPAALHDMYLRLLEAEVASEIADEIVSGVRDDLPGAGCDDPAAVRRAVARRLAAFVPVTGEGGAPDRASDGRPFTVALVGPTGVGKTTTLAKLAATYKLRQGRKVGLVTADTYRIAAVEQLRTYANIIGLPMQVAATPAEMSSACAALAECDCVLIDTAGRSPNDHERLDELRAFLDAARPHQTHLVLSSTASESCLLAAAERFAPAGPDRVIFTKLDEAVSFGVLVNVARRVDARLSWLTTGQEVPDKIEASRADRIAGLILDGRVVS